MPFAGLRVLSLESRRAKEMEALIRREGGDPFVAPSVQEKAVEDRGESLQFVERLEAGEFDLVISMTASGLAFLRDQMALHSSVERLGAALRKAVMVSRGPKPLPILRELGARAQVVVPEPNTWKEVVEAVALREERKIAVLEYGKPNPEMNAALRSLGSSVTPFVLYSWELPADIEPLKNAIQLLAGREFDVVLFTSSVQLEHLMRVAGTLGLQAEVMERLQRHTAVASIGPIMNDTLEAAGIPIDIRPIHPKMAGLVKAAAEESRSAILAKRKQPNLASAAAPPSPPTRG